MSQYSSNSSKCGEFAFVPRATYVSCGTRPFARLNTPESRMFKFIWCILVPFCHWKDWNHFHQQQIATERNGTTNGLNDKQQRDGVRRTVHAHNDKTNKFIYKLYHDAWMLWSFCADCFYDLSNNKVQNDNEHFQRNYSNF